MAAAESQSLDAIALAHDLRGCLLLRNGDVADSLPEFDQAIALVGSVAESEQPSLFLNRGSAHLYRRDLPAARDDLTTSATLAGRIGLTRLESKAMHNLGYAEYLAGNLPLALDTLARAHELDQDVARAGLLDRARVLIEAGLLDEAEEALAEASTGLRRQRANQDRAEADLARAEVALLQGNSTLARTHSGRARRDFRRRQSAGWQARADVTRWQAYLGAKGGPARVAREIRSAEAGRTSPSFDREVAIIAAEAQLALGHVDDAVVLLQTVQGRSATDSLTGRLHQHLVRAGVARAAGDPAAAQRELRVGLRTLAEQQARHHSLDLRTAMAVHGGRLAELDLRVALESSSPRMVFDSLERWRAMSHRRTAVTPPRDPELAALVSRLRIVAEDLRSAPPGARTELLQRQRRTVERQVREREWRLQGEGRSERSTTLAQLRPALTARGTEVVAYFVLDHRLGAVTVGRGRPRVHTLGSWAEVSALMTRVRADLDALAGRMLPAPLRVAVSSSLAHDLDKLDRLLLPDSLTASGALLVIPSRTLATAPWSLLPRRVGRPTTVALSATSWLRGLGEPIARPRVTALAGPGLALSGPEVQDVAATWPGGVAADSEHGSAAALATALVSSDLVHIAAHGQHNQDNPLFSSIRMADGPLYAYDVPPDEPVAAHIVLSACDLGLTTPRAGGEVLGLTAALLSIGATSVVSSVSRVDDTTAYETMLRYHRLLGAGLDSPTALAEALDGDVDMPAPFVCFGSPWSVAR
ncbi:MAG TPA: CHAT domain-containing protein [Lapillicoccus sp.]|uniref:CHAT domain-containing protein n=1 Tax=Lapillicoccus sp. TaxID=1909287 RepID=UPI002F93C9A5